MGKGAESISYMREAAMILERTVGAKDRRTQSELNNLTLALAADNQLAEAESLGRRLLSLREESLGARHIESVYARHNLARVLLQEGKYAEALPLEERAVNEITEILGPTNFRTLFMTNNLGAALEGTGQVDRAESVLRQTLELRRKIHGELHSNTQRTMAFLARVLLRGQSRGGSIVWRADSPAAGTHGSGPGEGSRSGSSWRRSGRDGRAVGFRPDSARADRGAGSGILAGRLVHGLCASLLGGSLLRQGRTSEATPLLNESVKAMEAAKITPAALLEKGRKRAGLVAQKLDR